MVSRCVRMCQDGVRTTPESHQDGVRERLGAVKRASGWRQDIMVSSGWRLDSVTIASGWRQDDATRT